MSGDTVYAVASGKGGVGKTTATANVAVAIAKLDYDVAIVDLDLGMANLNGWFALDPSGPTLHEVLADDADLTDAEYDAAGGVTIIPSRSDVESYTETDTSLLESVISDLRSRYDYVFLDIGAGISHETVLPLRLSDAAIIVTTPEEASLENANTTIELIHRLDGAVAGLIVNQTTSGDTLPESFTDEHMILGTIPSDSAVQASHETGIPHVLELPDSDATAGFMQVAERITGDEQLVSEQSDPLADAGLDSIELTTMDAIDVEDGQLHIDIEQLEMEDIDINSSSSDSESSDEGPADDSPVLALDDADTNSSTDEQSTDEGSDDTEESEDGGGFFSRLLR
ncbi:P-loop NTPase [Salinarchaeum sp. IM2453]|uniref:MinD/ParA family ATP-binding protein n=1 Tax=Salinarchaeum sp. IM2453 TaxID=2862870 RepID=UPI001C83591A|nr:P-loop NTPase [Salinarchaeum sp. IM2453]QZA89415.1 P-loop NTPase [Salinarchaeum sp. IM2453]